MLPIQYLSKESRRTMAELSSREENPLMPNIPNRSQRGRRSGQRQNSAALAGRASGDTINRPPVNGEAVQPVSQELVDAHENAKKACVEKKKAFDDLVAEMVKFVESHCTTFEGFKELGMEAAAPMIKEYIRLFISADGDYHQCVEAYIAARLLNPLAARYMINIELEEAIRDGLCHFGFDEFRRGSGLLDGMIGEIAKYRAAIDSTGANFWSQVEGAEKYDKDLREKAEEDPVKYAGRTWMDDRVETARRVWEWWRAKRHLFTYFSMAARLVATVLISSAAVERVFSQIKLIVEAVGNSALEETLETRVMERVNMY